LTQTRQMFVASLYAPYAAALSSYYGDLAEFVVGSLRTPVTRIVDIGCGTGHFTKAIHHSAPGTQIIGVDNNLSMQKYAQRCQTSESLNFIQREGLTFLRRTSLLPSDLVIFKGTYHLIDPAFNLICLTKALGSGATCIIIERMSLSAESYPLLPKAKRRLRILCSLSRQKRVVEKLRMAFVSFSTLTLGQYVEIPAAVLGTFYVNRQASYLAGISKREINKWVKQNLRRGSVHLFEEHTAYVFKEPLIPSCGQGAH
jgi:SAM-dependent methyltransferase